jgi:hypothetical protein
MHTLHRVVVVILTAAVASVAATRAALGTGNTRVTLLKVVTSLWRAVSMHTRCSGQMSSQYTQTCKCQLSCLAAQDSVTTSSH